MTRPWRMKLALVGSACVWLTALALAAHDTQIASPVAGKKAGEAFKNVTTSTLKELSVDDFIASMGLISANLGLDCADCHPNAGTDNADFTLFAKAPNQRAILIAYKDTQRPTSSWSFDGRTGWIKTPRGLLGEYELIGSELDGARFEAQIAFPGQIKQALSNWRGATTRSIGDRDFVVVQGSGPRSFLATL